jgi:hypothetical protein
MSRHWSITTAIAVSLVAAPLAAQRASRDTIDLNAVPIAIVAPSVVTSVGDRASLFAPTRPNTPIDTRRRAADVAPDRSMMPHDVPRDPAMMIVGGAAVLVGAVVGGKGGATIAVGGGVLGLIGLWNYLK